MDNVYGLLKDSGVELIHLELEQNGYYNPQLKIMFINQSLCESKQKEVILHELAHALKHREYSILYNKPTFKSKMEQEANYFMMDYLINESDGHFNYSDVFKNFKLGIGWEDKI